MYFGEIMAVKMKKRVAEKGFTLLEVMVAVALIAVALTTLLGSQSQSVSFANSAKFETMAALLAQSKMSEITSQDAEELRSDSGDFGDDYPGYTWEVSVSDLNFEGLTNISDYLKQIDLTVSWGVFNYNLRLYHYIGGTTTNAFSGRRRMGLDQLGSLFRSRQQGT